MTKIMIKISDGDYESIKRGMRYRDTIANIMQQIEDAEPVLSSSDLPNKWTPVNQPPKASGRYIVTRHFFDNDFVEMANYSTDLHTVDKYDFPKHKAGWYNDDSEYGHYELDDIVAWMSRPKPARLGVNNDES